MADLAEMREELQAKRKLHKTIFEEAAVDGDEHDLKQVMCLGSSVNDLEGSEKARRVAEIADELKAQMDELDEKIRTKEAVSGLEAVNKTFSTPRSAPRLPSSARDGSSKEALSYGEIAKRIVEDPTFKTWRSGNPQGRIEIDAPWLGASKKTLFETSAGFPPESTRTGQVVDIPLRPPQIVDIMPRGQTGQFQVAFMQQQTRTPAAAEVSEGAVKPEATKAFIEATSPVREIAVQIPVTDIQLEDVPFVEGLIETQLREDINERLDSQIVVGDGVAPNLTGILNTVGIQTVSGVGVERLEILKTAGTNLMTGAARARPTHVVIHPDDWDATLLTRSESGGVGTGEFLFGSPSTMVAPRVWGWPVVLNETLTPGEVLIGSFESRSIQLVERRGIVVERGLVGNQFIEDKQTIRATMRAAMVVFRPAAFITITGYGT